MRLTWKKAGLALLGGLILSSGIQSANAEVIFEDDFTTRLAEGPIVGSTPNIVTNGAQYEMRVAAIEGVPQFGEAKIDQTGIGQALNFNADNGLTSVWIPFQKDMTNSTDLLKFSLTFRKPTGTALEFNQFIMGFAGTGVNDGLTDFAMFLNNGRVTPQYLPGAVNPVNTRLDIATPTTNASYSSAVAPVVAQNLNTFILEYNPLDLATNPWSLTFNGEKAPIRKGGTSSFGALNAIGGVGFGNFNANGNFDRTMWLTNLKFEVIAQDEPGIEGDLDGDGFVGQTDLNLILGNWGQDVPPGDPLADPDGSGAVGQGDLNQVLAGWGQGTPPPPIAAVPEPATMVLMGLAGIGLLAARRFRRTA
ncbi:MAG: PEP-CTERM sorting domain-containing protein [Planctomycetota bacterium]|nr:PEP-CTERM sorting domain-containing protein [Planctomycetota bacterium]